MIVFRLWLILALLLGHAVANDGPLTITPSGYYLTVIGEDGQPTYVKIQTVIDLTGGTTPEDPDEPDEPAVDLELAAKVKAWASSASDPQSAQAIAAVYSHIRGAVNDGTLTTQSVWGPLRQATDSALGVIAGGSDWAGFRDKLTAEFTEAKQRGNLNTPKQIARLLASVQYGIELSADGSTALSMDQLVEIARRTNLAIDGATQ